MHHAATLFWLLWFSFGFGFNAAAFKIFQRVSGRNLLSTPLSLGLFLLGCLSGGLNLVFEGQLCEECGTFMWKIFGFSVNVHPKHPEAPRSSPVPALEPVDIFNGELPPDWSCRACGNVNFGLDSVCRKCRELRSLSERDGLPPSA